MIMIVRFLLHIVYIVGLDSDHNETINDDDWNQKNEVKSEVDNEKHDNMIAKKMLLTII